MSGPIAMSPGDLPVLLSKRGCNVQQMPLDKHNGLITVIAEMPVAYEGTLASCNS